MADFLYNRASAWIAGDFIGACVGVFRILEFGGTAAGVFGRSFPMAVVALPAGNSSGEGGHGSGGLGSYVASCGVCVFYGTGLFGAGDCGFGDERVKGEWRVLCCAGRWIVWNLDFGEWGYGLGGWGWIVECWYFGEVYMDWVVGSVIVKCVIFDICDG